MAEKKEEKVDLSEAQQVQIRLAGIRRTLDDFDKAVTFAQRSNTDYQSLNDEIPKLKQERDSLNAEKVKIEDETKVARAEHQKLMDSLQTKRNQANEQLNKRVSDLQAKLDEMEKRATERSAEIDKEWNGLIAAKKKELQEAEQRLAAIIELIESHKAAAARL